jgi:acetyl esterase/lipase
MIEPPPPPAIVIHADIAYATVGVRTLSLDLHRPGAAFAESPAPLVVHVHGGGWQGGSRKDFTHAWLLAHGFVVASIDYRLATESLFPAQLDDVRAALRWLGDHAGEHGGDATRLAVFGESAGGLLALLVAANDAPPGLPRVRAVVSAAGATDLVLRSRTQPAATDFASGVVFGLLGGPVAERLELARAASPASRVGPRFAPALLLHGEVDNVVLLDQPRRLRELCAAAGLEATLHVVPGAGHLGPDFYDDETRRLVLAFLDRHLRTPSAPVPP